jgi:hypothetical protein
VKTMFFWGFCIYQSKLMYLHASFSLYSLRAAFEGTPTYQEKKRGAFNKKIKKGLLANIDFTLMQCEVGNMQACFLEQSIGFIIGIKMSIFFMTMILKTIISFNDRTHGTCSQRQRGTETSADLPQSLSQH